MGNSQQRHHNPDQDQGDPLRPLAHLVPPFRLDTFRVFLSTEGVESSRIPNGFGSPTLLLIFAAGVIIFGLTRLKARGVRVRPHDVVNEHERIAEVLRGARQIVVTKKKPRPLRSGQPNDDGALLDDDCVRHGHGDPTERNRQPAD